MTIINDVMTFSASDVQQFSSEVQNILSIGAAAAKSATLDAYLTQIISTFFSGVQNDILTSAVQAASAANKLSVVNTLKPATAIPAIVATPTKL